MSPQAAFGVFLILLGASSPVFIVGLVYYLKKRLEHKQIMTAIEKGTPLPQLRPPKPQPAGPAWIRYLAIGIALLIIAFGFLVHERMETAIAFIIFGVGAAWVIRGLLHRKYHLKSQSSNQNNNTTKVANSA